MTTIQTTQAEEPVTTAEVEAARAVRDRIARLYAKGRA